MIDFNNLPCKDKIYYKEEGIVIYCADCRDILPLLPDKSIDLVLTDPPYPDQHPEYGVIDLDLLEKLTCQQLVFWSAKVPFPLDYTAIHVWHKICGATVASEYEHIIERNGGRKYRVFTFGSGSSPISAQIIRDIFTGHPSQKPQQLINRLVVDFSNPDALILDPFLGSGTTAYCAKKLGRKCIGVEIEEKYCKIAVDRLRQNVMRLDV